MKKLKIILGGCAIIISVCTGLIWFVIKNMEEPNPFAKRYKYHLQ